MAAFGPFKQHHMKSLLINIVLACCTTVVFTACQQKAAPESNHPEGHTPLPPEKAALELHNPPPPAEISAQAMNDRENTRFQYHLQFGEEKVKGNLSGTGKATKVDKDLVAIQWNDGKELSLGYRLPVEGKALMVDIGQDLSVELQESLPGSGMQRLFTLGSGKGTIVSSGRQSMESPIVIKVSEGITLRQSTFSEKEVLVKSERDTHYGVPLVLLAGGKQLKVPADGQPFVFQAGENLYELRVLANGFVRPETAYEDVSEGQGYYLDYWLYRTK